LRLPPAAICLLVLPVAACGSGGAAASATPVPRVTVSFTGPADAATVRSAKVVVQGRVSPADASVEVDGEHADVNGGVFMANVELETGANLIDVTAAAPGRRADADSLRLTYDARIRLPQLAGLEQDAATQKLRALGFDVQSDRRDGFLDRLLPGPLEVCGSDPGAGAPLAKGATVTLIVKRSC